MGRCALIAADFAASFVVAGAASAATVHGRNGRIAFTAQVGSQTQVFTMRSNGTGARQLSHEAAGAADPDWLPGGRQLVYARSDGLATLMGAGGNIIGTIKTDEPISDPAMSPDGKRLVFTVTSDGLYDGPSIYTADANGNGLQRLASGSDPQWSPDGHWIAYVSVPADTGCSGVRLMEPDGSNDHAVAQGAPVNAVCHDGAVAPSFSPDSRRVLYVAIGIKTPHKQNGSDLYTVSIHGGAHKRLTRDDLSEANPVFAPNGKSVLFSATGGHGRQNGTFLISASGKHRRRIGPPHVGLSWQPLPAG